MNKLLRWWLLGLSMAFAQAQATPILQVQGGILTGAKYVDVAGTFYDVEFLDGTCIALFGGCYPPVDFFAFTTQTAVRVASQALLDQVFIDGPAGSFDSQSALTRGCTSSEFCMVATPYGLIQYGRGLALLGTFTVNYAAWRTDWDYVNELYLVATAEGDLGEFNWSTYARWTESSTPHPGISVPEPGTFACLGGGLLGLVLARCRRRQRL